jgi:hypothetical protein
LHAIAERIGAGQPTGMVFKGRVPTGRHFNELPNAAAETNLITSRILWLTGLEPGVNQGGDVDTHDRYIYIHGTNRGPAGHPAQRRLRAHAQSRDHRSLRRGPHRRPGADRGLIAKRNGP